MYSNGWGTLLLLQSNSPLHEVTDNTTITVQMYSDCVQTNSNSLLTGLESSFSSMDRWYWVATTKGSAIAVLYDTNS